MDHIIELRKRVALLEKQLENALSYVRPMFEQQRKYLEDQKAGVINMGMYRNRMPDREVSEAMTKADYWEVQADMWHQTWKEADDEIEQLRKDKQLGFELMDTFVKENNRLKQVLQQIAEEGSGHGQALAYAALKEDE
jgi:hypothetical protein